METTYKLSVSSVGNPVDIKVVWEFIPNFLHVFCSVNAVGFHTFDVSCSN
jgi:hypothetical protein